MLSLPNMCMPYSCNIEEPHPFSSAEKSHFTLIQRWPVRGPANFGEKVVQELILYLFQGLKQLRQ